MGLSFNTAEGFHGHSLLSDHGAHAYQSRRQNSERHFEGAELPVAECAKKQKRGRGKVTSLLSLVTTLAKLVTFVAQFFARRQLIKAGEDKAKAEFQGEALDKVKRANSVRIGGTDNHRRLLDKWSRD